MMKVLDVQPFHEGIHRNTAMLQRLCDEAEAISKSVEGLVALEDSLKGEGGDAIRAFYAECHLPFLLFFDTTSREFIDKLRWMKNALESLESNPMGYIKEAFLDGEVEEGLQDISILTESLTNESNRIMDQVADIVDLPYLNDRDVQDGVRRAGTRRDETLTQLGAFDLDQTNALTSVAMNLMEMETWISELEILFVEGLTDVDFSAGDWRKHQRYSPIRELHHEEQFSSLESHPRVTEHEVNVCYPNHDNDGNLWGAIASEAGVNVNDWRDEPLKAFGNFIGTGDAVFATGQEINLARKGFGIRRADRVTAQGKHRVVIKLDNPHLIGVRKKTYSGTNATNYTKIFSRVDPMTSMKQSFKFVGNRIGYVGLGAGIAGDLYHGRELPATEVAGNVTATTAVGVTSIAASALAAAKVGAYAGGFGGPVGVVAGATAGLVLGAVVSVALDNVKVFDVDGDGERDSVGDIISKGTTSMLNKVSSWFK